jgi:hypothetical protein
MKSRLLGVSQTGPGEPRSLPLFLSVLLALGALLVLCDDGAPSALGAPSFAPLPKPSTFVLTNAIILVTPPALNFGSVPLGKGATNTFLVENVGRGRLVGAVSVPAPFKIISGGTYALTEKEIQVVTVAYTPGRPGTNTATVTFTGAGGAKATVTGQGLSGPAAN